MNQRRRLNAALGDDRGAAAWHYLPVSLARTYGSENKKACGYVITAGLFRP
jgi:hypothetical protein